MIDRIESPMNRTTWLIEPTYLKTIQNPTTLTRM